MTRSAEVVRATDEFNLIWQNDYDLYHAVVEYVRGLLRGVPNMTDQTIGVNVKGRVFAWAYGGGWGWDSGWDGSVTAMPDADRFPGWQEGPPPAGYKANPFSYFLARDDYRYVDEVAVGEAAREALGVES